jgi:hypothetical protein
MVERADGHRVLLAPSPEVAGCVGSTYAFDEVRIGPVRAAVARSAWRVGAAPLDLEFTVWRRTAAGRVLRAVPRRLATRPWWVAAVDVALDLHGLTAARVRWEGADQGALAPVTPPVRFGFGSTPRSPSLTRIVTLRADAADVRLEAPSGRAHVGGPPGRGRRLRPRRVRRVDAPRPCRHLRLLAITAQRVSPAGLATCRCFGA